MAKVIPRNPISSLNRWFSVGVSKRTAISRILGKDRTESHRKRRRWSRGSPVEEPQKQNEYTKDEAVNNKDLERACLQIPQQRTDYRIAHHGRYGDGNQQRRERQFHPARTMHAHELRHFFEGCADDQRRREQKGEPRGRLPRHLAPEPGDDRNSRARNARKDRQSLRRTYADGIAKIRMLQNASQPAAGVRNHHQQRHRDRGGGNGARISPGLFNEALEEKSHDAAGNRSDYQQPE